MIGVPDARLLEEDIAHFSIVILFSVNPRSQKLWRILGPARGACAPEFAHPRARRAGQAGMGINLEKAFPDWRQDRPVRYGAPRDTAREKMHNIKDLHYAARRTSRAIGFTCTQIGVQMSIED